MIYQCLTRTAYQIADLQKKNIPPQQKMTMKYIYLAFLKSTTNYCVMIFNC